MKITFNINYSTRWGETLHICGELPALGGGDDRLAPAMKMVGPAMWQLTVDADEVPETSSYRYIVKPEQGAWRLEWGDAHILRRCPGAMEYRLYDCWQDQPLDKPYYSSAFVDGILRRSCKDQPLRPAPGMLTVRVSAPMIAPGERLAMAGSIPALGNWNPRQALQLNDAHYPVWEAQIPLSALRSPFEYKFLITSRDNPGEAAWEVIANRSFGISVEGCEDCCMVLDGLRFATPRSDWRGAGTAIPVFSLRSEADFGAGDFADIRLMVDWCARTGQKVLQLLPVNDTTMTRTWVDSYPYKANSTFALHPMYLRLEEAGTPDDEESRRRHEALRRELNALPTVDYERVCNAKEEYMRDIYRRQGADTMAGAEYRRFEAANRDWLTPYAVWCTLRDINGTADNNQWGDMAKYDAQAVEQFAAGHAAEAGYYCFVQFHLDRQLRAVRDYAHQNGVVLKGDIPIGISRFSVDAWMHPELFNMDVCAGAPPDDFSVMGQNWGFPTYNWEVMARDGFAWWKARLRKMSEYFDAYRIDHILGFFRIWQIPVEAEHGLLGYFNPALPYTPEEMRHGYDFWINPDIHTRPYIMEWVLSDFFGEHAAAAKERYLEPSGEGRFRLRPEVDTQAKVSAHFAALEQTEENTRLRDGLMGLIDDVLFIEDPAERGKYHPRISAQFTYQYRALNDYERQCFDRLYNDFFYRRHDEFWRGKAMWKLPPLIESTRMLSCAEDLGMIPGCVPDVMRSLEILSLEIQRMPKDTSVEFADTWAYPYYSVCTTSTHDMSGIRAWWEEDRARSQRFYAGVLHQQGDAPYFAEPWVCRSIADMHLSSPSMLCILPLQDWLAADGDLRRENPADEQINVPANPKHYWRYRMHLTIERLLGASRFNDELAARIAASGR